jgi:hypothetical protein
MGDVAETENKRMVVNKNAQMGAHLLNLLQDFKDFYDKTPLYKATHQRMLYTV